MEDKKWDVVTGATGYTGKYITKRLLAKGRRVKSLTGHPDRENPFGDQVSLLPFNFENKNALVESLRGAQTIFNTYWVRFNHGGSNYDMAVRNTKVLFQAAKEAGVERFVHVSIANPDKNSALPYYRGKGILEEELITSGLSYAIVRPTVIFGDEDILINNIAWLLRMFPAFVVPGAGEYKIQPIFVEDMADLVINAAESKNNIILDAVGPDILPFKEMVYLIRDKIKSKAKIIHLPPFLALQLSRIIGVFLGDVVLTKEEVKGLMDNLLESKHKPTGKTRLTGWLAENSSRVGAKYASEVKRHFK